MKVTRVEAIPLWVYFADALGGADNVPGELSQPAFGNTTTPLLGQGCVIVQIYTDEGLVGVGETMGRPGPRGNAAFIEDVLAPMLLGKDPTRVEAHWADMNRALSFAPMAVSGVDIALWDLRGQVYGEPVHRLLGGPLRMEVDCYASPVPYLPTPEASAERARKFIDEGFNAVKLKVGRGIGTDLGHVAAVRAELGPRVQIMVDANGAYTVAESVRLARGLERENISWLEEPVNFAYPAQLAEIRRKVDLPVASGECLGTISQFHDLVVLDAVDVVMPNITRCGGITGFRRVAELAELKNIPVAPHGVGSAIGILAALHAIAATQNYMIYEYNQLFNPLRHAVLCEPLTFRDGRLAVPSGLGLGAAVRKETLVRFQAGRLDDSRLDNRVSADGSTKRISSQ